MERLILPLTVIDSESRTLSLETDNRRLAEGLGSLMDKIQQIVRDFPSLSCFLISHPPDSNRPRQAEVQIPSNPQPMVVRRQVPADSTT